MLEDGSIVYDSYNIHASMPHDSYLITKHNLMDVKLGIKRNTNEITLSRNGSNYNNQTLKITKEGIDDLINSLETFSTRIKTMHQNGTLNTLKNYLGVTPYLAQFKDPITGLELMSGTYGVAFLATRSGLILSTTPYVITVKDLDGQMKNMNVSEDDTLVKVLNHALGQEAKYWISMFK